MDHKKFMQRALDLSKAFQKTHKGGPFGAVIVKDNKIIGEGHNQVTELMDPTAHAEISAIRNAAKNTNHFSLEDTIIYTSCEPCPMCLAAIYWARIKAIYFCHSRQDAASAGFDDEFLYQEMNTEYQERKIPIQLLKIQETKTCFDFWKGFEHKQAY